MEKVQLELHYFFNDDTHEMDAFVRHRCEGEFLAVAKEILSTFSNGEFEILCEIPNEGGFIDKFRLFCSQNQAAMTVAGVTAGLLIQVMVLVMSRKPPIHPAQLENLQLQNEMIPAQKKLIEAQTKVALSQEELNKSIKRKTDLEIVKLKNDSLLNANTLSLAMPDTFKQYVVPPEELEGLKIRIARAKKFNLTLAKDCAEYTNRKLNVIQRKSNFYKTLQSYPKVTSVSTKTFVNGKSIGEGQTVKRSNFHEYILNSNKLKKVITDTAIIELTSPVIKLKSKIKWRGMYNGKPISFKMKDEVFKKKVADNTAGVHDLYFFKAVLSYTPELQEDGTLLEVGYTVETVLGEVDGKDVRLTEQGKKYERDKRLLASQGKLEF